MSLGEDLGRVLVLVVVLGGCRGGKQPAKAQPDLPAKARTSVVTSAGSVSAASGPATPALAKPPPATSESAPPPEQAGTPARLEDGVWVVDKPGPRDKSCLIHRHCNVQPAPIQPCAPGRQAPEWSRVVATLDDSSGHATNYVTFSGPLRLAQWAMTTFSLCSPGTCCNSVNNALALGDSPNALVLHGLTCTGDESRQCCAIPPRGQRVIATGRLTGSNSATERWHLDEASICLPQD
jgi:hypothetical protein